MAVVLKQSLNQLWLYNVLLSVIYCISAIRKVRSCSVNLVTTSFFHNTCTMERADKLIDIVKLTKTDNNYYYDSEILSIKKRPTKRLSHYFWE